jgi:hypothetical protein
MFGQILSNTVNDNDAAFAVDRDAKILRVSNIKSGENPTGLFGNNDLEWHNDFAHSPGNYHGTMLYNEIGGELAETIFCDTRSAYYDLSAELQDMVNDRIGHHRVTEKAYRRLLSNAEKRLLNMTKWKPKNAEFSLACVHPDDTLRPIAPIHPVTGKRSLYLAPATYVGSNPEITEEEYSNLLVHCEQSKYIYSHKWQSNDILVFDNLSTMHRRSAFKGDRVLWRMQFNYDKHMVR